MPKRNPQNLFGWWRGIGDALTKGKDPGESREGHWNETNIQGGRGASGPKISSANHCTLAAVIELCLAFHAGNMQRVHRILDAWFLYFTDFPLQTVEPESGFIYGRWIREPQLVVLAIAEAVNRQDVVQAATRSLTTSYILAALSASRVNVGPRWTGPLVTAHHTRSAISIKDGRPEGKRRDENGIAKPIFMLDDGPHNEELGMALGLTEPGAELAATAAAVKSKLDLDLFWFLSETMHSDLDELRTADGALTPDEAAAFNRVVAWLEEFAHWPSSSWMIGRSAEGVWSVVEDSVNPGSTDTINYKAFFNDRVPAIPETRYFRELPWSIDNRVLAAWAGDCSRRSQGRDGVTEMDLTHRTVRCQRKSTKDHYDQMTNEFKPGWRETILPGGEWSYVIRYGERIGLEVLRGPEVTEPPVEPPVDPPTEPPEPPSSNPFLINAEQRLAAGNHHGAIQALINWAKKKEGEL